ncbi:gamma-glutamylcyclotransferase [Roseomonas sp. SSH11]|uniref:glutathione-specific gamma-glutamylcyclotransferase n=1 Tax=Pararoseomonas baculiformis TaxID=2820812 RepID=A0ABS4AEK6_9PROT|nr:gamma-glutamylcyclotransferase [Pararoseomonas baculiformis]MBP0445453.1 gamma-glutamylcyclotransferase [Pararoseomonas baculiformis]
MQDKDPVPQAGPGPGPAGPEESLAGTATPPPQLMTREHLLSGAVERMVRESGSRTLLTDEQREASLRDTLAARPADADAVWLFGYGSLIWNPTIHYAESRVASVEGWKRAFCLSTPAGRGTPDNPGLVLALDKGGRCTGVAFRIAEEVLEDELSIVWRREMLTGAYIPHWVPLRGEDGVAFGHGIAFTINPRGPQYCDLPEDEIIRRLATARGQLGSSSEYLFQTRDGLRSLGIQDPLVDHLSQAVLKAQGAG